MQGENGDGGGPPAFAGLSGGAAGASRRGLRALVLAGPSARDPRAPEPNGRGCDGEGALGERRGAVADGWRQGKRWRARPGPTGAGPALVGGRGAAGQRPDTPDQSAPSPLQPSPDRRPRRDAAAASLLGPRPAGGTPPSPFSPGQTRPGRSLATPGPTRPGRSLATPDLTRPGRSLAIPGPTRRAPSLLWTGTPGPPRRGQPRTDDPRADRDNIGISPGAHFSWSGCMGIGRAQPFVTRQGTAPALQVPGGAEQP
jgi:hypothetical protein